MGEEILALLREAATTLAGSPVATQAEQDVKDVESIVAKHVAAQAEEIKSWLITRLHRVLGDGQAAPDVPAAPDQTVI